MVLTADETARPTVGTKNQGLGPRVLGNMPEFNNGNEDFEDYLERLESYLEVNEIQPQQKVDLLITLIGAETYHTLKRLCVPDKPRSKSFEVLSKLLSSHFSPEKSIRIERFKFHERKQLEEESLSAYIVELKQLANACRFTDIKPADFYEEALRDMFVVGVRDKGFQKMLLEKSQLTFEKACQMAATHELTATNTRVLHGQEDVHQLANQFMQLKSQQCWRCGRYHDHQNCAVRHWEGFQCNKVGHTAKMCRQPSLGMGSSSSSSSRPYRVQVESRQNRS